jgi:hypothetical protein
MLIENLFFKALALFLMLSLFFFIFNPYGDVYFKQLTDIVVSLGNLSTYPLLSTNAPFTDDYGIFNFFRDFINWIYLGIAYFINAFIIFFTFIYRLLLFFITIFQGIFSLFGYLMSLSPILGLVLMIPFIILLIIVIFGFIMYVLPFK